VQLDTALPWLALCLTRGIAARLSARLLKQLGSPENVFRAPLRQLEARELPAATAQAICKKRGIQARGKRVGGYSHDSRLPTGELERPEYP
jgi:predicted Rossmann fold nucleotide-binding protein DprA/Smf involved in DNA uptake